MSLKKKIFGNGIATAFQKLIRVFEQLLLVPFFITAWGTAYYGEWITLAIIPSIIAFSDLGFGSAAANSFVLRYASGDKQGAANISKSGFLIISLMVIVGLLVSCIAMYVLADYGIFEKSLINAHDAIIAVSILIFSKLIGFYSQFFDAYYRAARKAALSINMLSINAALNLVSGIIVLNLGYGVIEFAASQLVVAVLFNIVFGATGRRILGLEKEFKGVATRPDIKDIMAKGLGYLMSPIWQSIYFQGTTFVVRLTLGPEAVAVFNTVRTVSRSVNQMFSMVNATIFPELQYEIGAGNFQKAHKLYRLAIWIAFSTAVAGVIFLMLFGPWFYNIWTKNELVAPPLMWNIFIIGILFNALWWTAGVVFRAVNKPYQFAVIGVVSAVVSVIASYFLSIQFGLTGAAVGSLVLEIILAIFVLPLSSKLIGITVKDVIVNGRQDLVEIFKILKRKIIKK